ncbi:protein Niban 1a [Pseudoliparis swirei]|uniref:protein Niban 1a n=1 Tax=Pseudoliparis swirei TaxID=2059687 RepID=UPI0024BE2605|nr:protein Niban 1a [Pseudoliparis swirei]
MGISASSLLDESKSNYIKGQAEAELKEFSPYYTKQFSLARFSELEDDLEQHKEKITQLLKQRVASEGGEVLYEERVFFFDETRKWKERYVVVRANYCLECHDGLETFVKGTPARQTLLPTGGAVLTTEDKYMAMVDQCFPDDTSVKEDFTPPLSGMPAQFPVYLRLPYRRDSYFCFRQEVKRDAFLSILSDCIRHQNQDFLKKKTCEVQAFLKAIQLYRQDKGKYEAWDMLIGSDVRVMANVVMEQLLPSLEKDMLPRLKAKKMERKRVWFATVEAAYVLIQEHLLEGLSALKEECRTSVRQQEVLIHSDMDQILNSRQQLEEKVRAKVSERAEKLCSESVQPYLASVLEELMEPVSSGFLEGRQLSEHAMDQVCQDVLQLVNKEELKKALADMARPNLLGCYQKIGSLQEKLQHLQERFGFSNISGVIHSAQIDLQQLTENAAYTFEQLLHKVFQDNPDNPGSAVEKAKHRVLKQYDYDSSTVRKRISREALVSITLPFIKKNLASCKAELQDIEQSLDGDYTNYIHVENVYERILLQSLDKEVIKVVKEAASLKKYNLFTDSRDLLSQSSRSSLSSPAVSSSETSVEPPSPLVANGLPHSPLEERSPEKSEDSPDAPVIDTPTTDTPTTDTPVIDTPIFDTPVNDMPVIDTPTTDTPVTDTPVIYTTITDTPITDAPVIDTPITDTPTTDTPITDTPVIDTPVIDTPTTDTPVTDTPVIYTTITDTPITDAPVIDTPVIDTPVIDTPITDTPTTDTPITDTPVIDTPVIDTPTTDTPVTDASVIDTPTTDTPVTDAPVIDTSVIDTPTTDTPITDTPITDAPVTDTPVIDTPLGEVEQKDAAQSAAVGEEAAAVSPAVADSSDASGSQEVNAEASPEAVIREEEIPVETETVETVAEPQAQRTDAPKETEVTLSGIPVVVESIKTDGEEAAQVEAPVPSSGPPNGPASPSAEGTGSQTAASSEGETIKLETPSGGQAPELTSADICPNSKDVSVGSESAPLDVEDAKTTPSSGDEASSTSDAGGSPVTSVDPAGDKAASDEPSPEAQREAEPADAAASQPSEPAGCIKEIRDLAVEEMVQRCPDVVPKEEE